MNTYLRFCALAAAVVAALAADDASAAVRASLLSIDVAHVERTNSTYRKTAAAEIPATGDASSKPMDHTRHEAALGLDPQSRLVLLKRESRDGARIYRYQQTFNGLPVIGDHAIVREDANGRVEKLYGSRFDGLASDISPRMPRISAARALSVAKASALGFRRDSIIASSERTQLVIHVDDAGYAHKAYQVTFEARKPNGGPSLPNVLVDADTGALLRATDAVRAAFATGPGGNGLSGKYEYGTLPWDFLKVTQFTKTCTLQNSVVKTVDMGGISATFAQIAKKGAYSFACSKNLANNDGEAINGTYAPQNDAHYFGTKTAEMYQSYTSRAVAGGVIILGVNVKYSSGRQDNASADGTGGTGSRAVMFGNGTSASYAMGTLDGVAHEMSHIFTAEHSSLTNWNGNSATQAGAMDEAFSDMAEEAANFFVNGSNDFLFWNDAYRDKSAARNLCAPALPYYGNASQWTGTDYYPHYGSTIYSKAFCTLAKTAGWDTKKAFQVFADANANAWTPSTNFNTGACGVEDAATARGYVKADVTAAFKEVGVACPASVGSLPRASKGRYATPVR